MLKIRDLYKSYQIGQTMMPVLKGINLDVQQGDL
ncbi:MAG: macrolide ABC transporter ATP-binding protein, partial [Candidatus Electrothrix sp. ATG1]|nr:macrolide ABC transporter ATP-binding protein [Candidatus Electrothrix sp. ATG1]